jgi:RNA polymerase sigma factor (sigma-70 family)
MRREPVRVQAPARSGLHRKVDGDLRAPSGRLGRKTRPEVAFHLEQLDRYLPRFFRRFQRPAVSNSYTPVNSDADLLERYSRSRADEAFAELVRRHLDFVYATALRQLGGDAHLAADASQQIFLALARHARALAKTRALKGWLYTATRNAAANLVRTEQRRRAREREAHLMEHSTHDATATDPHDVRLVLDRALGTLNDRERELVFLRFFEDRDTLLRAGDESTAGYRVWLDTWLRKDGAQTVESWLQAQAAHRHYDHIAWQYAALIAGKDAKRATQWAHTIRNTAIRQEVLRVIGTRAPAKKAPGS